MQLKFEAGQLSISTWTDGHPMWMELKCARGDSAETIRFHHEELKNLAFIVERMMAQGRANMPDRYKHEFD